MKRLTIPALLIILSILIIFLLYKDLSKKNSVSATVSSTITENSMINGVTKDQIEKIVHNYIAKHPDVILESIDLLEKQFKQDMLVHMNEYLDTNKDTIEDVTNYPFMGNADGKVIIVYFYDYNCGYCKKSDQVLKQLVENDANIKIIFKPLPLLGALSQYMARIDLAVYALEPEKFIKIHDDLMKLSDANQANIDSVLNANEINLEKIQNLINSDHISQLIDQDREIAMKLDIKRIPSYIINGTKLFKGFADLKTLQGLVDN
ncbi:MAG: DsbA family protein [Rickettsiaceae bacterium]